MTTVAHAPPPGARVRVRGEEWAVEKSLPLPFGDGYAVHVQGLSELVRHHKAIFLTPLDEVTELRPEDTKLVGDPTPHYRQTMLYLETLLRRMPPTHPDVAIGHRGALEAMGYQLVPAQRALAAIKPRILIADGTGLGKTVEVGIVLSELIKRGRGRRILVVAIRSMLAQLQRELWARFTLPLVRLDSEGLTRVQAKLPANKNPFSYFDRCIVSMDTLKNQGLYRAWLEQIRWDVIVVDECHNVANHGSQRGELARLLASQCDALVMTSATPHNGRPESFANLMRMLDPTSVADPKHFGKEDVEKLFVRRFKKDVEKEAGDQLKDRDVATLAGQATTEEEAALAALHALELSTLRGKRVRRDPLVKWTLVKAFLSSAEACLESLDHRIAVTEAALVPPTDGTKILVERKVALENDLSGLVHAKRLVEAARAAGARKLEKLLAELEGLGVRAKKGGERVVVFSERIRTLAMLKDAIGKHLSLPPEAIGVFTASQGGAGLGSDARDEKAQRALVESFGHADSPLRVLLCSDAASEGVNLHHQCHHLYHYDVPWSLIRLTQRNGRIDRFGQKRTPFLRYMVTTSTASTADQHVTKRLIEKEQQVERQLGDPGALLGLYDAELEEDYVLRGVAADRPLDELLPEAPRAAEQAAVARASLSADDAEDGEASTSSGANALEAETDGPPIDLLALLAQVEAEQKKAPPAPAVAADAPSLFESDYELLVAALRHVERSPIVGPEPLQWTDNPSEKAITVLPPEPFVKYREPFLPDEATPRKREPYRLVQDRELVKTKLQSALDDEGRWPDWHLLWEQHPLVEWVLDALASAYARGEAPVLRAPALGKDHAIFLVQGVFYNHESEGVLARMSGLRASLGSEPGKLEPHTLSLDDVLAQTGLKKGLANPGHEPRRRAALQALVPPVIERARQDLAAERKTQVETEIRKVARAETRRVEAWADDSLALLDKQAAAWSKATGKIPHHLAVRLQREREHVAHVKANHAQLVKSLSAAGEPYLRLVAVFSGDA